MKCLQLTPEQCRLVAEWGGWYSMVWPKRHTSIDQYLEKKLRNTRYSFSLRSADCEFILKWYTGVQKVESSLLTPKDRLIADFIQGHVYGIL